MKLNLLFRSKVGHNNLENLRNWGLWPFFPSLYVSKNNLCHKSLSLNAISLAMHEIININNGSHALLHLFETVHKENWKIPKIKAIFNGMSYDEKTFILRLIGNNTNCQASSFIWNQVWTNWTRINACFSHLLYVDIYETPCTHRRTSPQLAKTALMWTHMIPNTITTDRLLTIIPTRRWMSIEKLEIKQP